MNRGMVSDKPQRILYVMPSPLRRAGTETYAMNYYRHFDRSKIQIDFLVHGFEKGDFDSEVDDLGGGLYQVHKRGLRVTRNIGELRKFFATNHYDLVHVHMDAGNYLVLKIAREAGVPIRISHSHNTDFQTDNALKLAWDRYQQKRIPQEATHLFACSKAAAEWLYGAERLSEVHIVPNAIDLTKFAYNVRKRWAIRNKIGIAEDAIAIGHVGRFSYQKNHEFLIDVFTELLGRNMGYELVLIGDGENQTRIRELAEGRGIAEHVVMVGAVDNAADYYSALDIFALPSHFEGLPVVGVEAQANGLPCLFSDKITTEVNFTGDVEFLPIEGDAAVKTWANVIKALGMPLRNTGASDLLRAAGYDIEESARMLEETYRCLLASIQ